MYVSVLKHTIGLMGTLVGTLLEAIKAEKSFAITPANIGYAFADGMGVCFSFHRLD